MTDKSDLTKTLTATPDRSKPPAPRRARSDQQSRAGVASFVLALTAAAAIVQAVLRSQGLQALAGTGEGSAPTGTFYVTIVFGGALVLEVVALVLGLMGTFQRRTRRTMGVAGAALAAAMLLAVLSVLLL